MSNTINGSGGTSQLDLSSSIAAGSASAGQSASSDQSKSWFEAMAKAWGSALDKEAQKITSLSDQLGSGTQGAGGSASGGSSDDPSVLTMLTTESLKMQFLSTSASTSINAAGQSQDTVARKQ